MRKYGLYGSLTERRIKMLIKESPTLLANWSVQTLKKWAAEYIIPAGVGVFILYAVVSRIFPMAASSSFVSWLALIVFVAAPTTMHFLCVDELIDRARKNDRLAFEALNTLGLSPILELGQQTLKTK